MTYYYEHNVNKCGFTYVFSPDFRTLGKHERHERRRYLRIITERARSHTSRPELQPVRLATIAPGQFAVVLFKQ